MNVRERKHRERERDRERERERETERDRERKLSFLRKLTTMTLLLRQSESMSSSLSSHKMLELKEILNMFMKVLKVERALATLKLNFSSFVSLVLLC